MQLIAVPQYSAAHRLEVACCAASPILDPYEVIRSPGSLAGVPRDNTNVESLLTGRGWHSCPDPAPCEGLLRA